MAEGKASCPYMFVLQPRQLNFSYLNPIQGLLQEQFHLHLVCQHQVLSNTILCPLAS